MSILVNKQSRVVTQGVTGKTGSFHTKFCLDYSNGQSCFLAGVTPGKKGQVFEGIPIYDSVRDAKHAVDCDVSVIYVPPRYAAAAIEEAVEAEIGLIVCITEGIPVLDMVRISEKIRNSKSILLGPNCPGIITPGEIKVGIMPGYIHHPGSIGVVSRSGTLTYEVVDQLTKLNLGQSTCVGIGGDPVNGLKHRQILEAFNQDEQTKAVVMCGEIGGNDEERCAEWISENMKKPVVAFIAGLTAPSGKRMGHAGAIISGGQGTAKGKIGALREAGVHVSENPAEIGSLMKEVLGTQFD